MGYKILVKRLVNTKAVRLTRVRSRDNNPEKVGCNYTLYTYVNNEPTTYGNYTRNPVLTERRVVESMVDEVTPDFLVKSRQGRIVNFPMSQNKTITSESTAPFSYSATYMSGQYKMGWWASGSINTSVFGTPSDCIYYPPLPDLSYDLEVMSGLAVTKAWANIENSKALIAATAAEGKKTVQSLASILYRAYKIFKAIKRLDIQSLKGEICPKELADRYMEARYAIRPLIYDARQITDALQHAAKKPHRQTFRGQETKSSVNTTSGSIGLHPSVELNYVATASRHVACRAGVLTQVEAVTQLNNWGLDGPIETMWELTPFSFIADWFFNIGDVIASWTPEMGTRALASWCVSSVTETYAIVTNGGNITIEPNNPLDLHVVIPPIEMSKTTISKERTVSPRRSVIPTFTVNLDPAKLLDLAIIIKKLS